MLLVTYCSKDKRTDDGTLPAIDRYLSPRIAAVHRAAEQLGCEFRILSGKFGLLAAADPIPQYDHLLTDGEVSAHARVVASQLESVASAASDPVVLVSRPLSEDPHTRPYREVMEAACLRTNACFVPLTFARDCLGTVRIVHTIRTRS